MTRDASEPQISVNGVPLTEAQAMTVRVALGHFWDWLKDEGSLGNDETGRHIAGGYRTKIREIFHIMRHDKSVALCENCRAEVPAPDSHRRDFNVDHVTDGPWTCRAPTP